MGHQSNPIVFTFVFFSSCLVASNNYMIDGFIYVSWSSTFVIFHILFDLALNSLGHRIAAIQNDSVSHFRCSLRNHFRVISPVRFSLSLETLFSFPVLILEVSDSLFLFLSILYTSYRCDSHSILIQPHVVLMAEVTQSSVNNDSSLPVFHFHIKNCSNHFSKSRLFVSSSLIFFCDNGFLLFSCVSSETLQILQSCLDCEVSFRFFLHICLPYFWLGTWQSTFPFFYTAQKYELYIEHIYVSKPSIQTISNRHVVNL